MKLITQVEDDMQFLSMTYDAAEVIEEIVEKTDIMEIRKRKPQGLEEIFEEDSDEEKERKKIKNNNLIKKQSKENLREMAKKLLRDYPEEAIKLCHTVTLLDEGEEYPHGFALLGVLLRVMMDGNFLGFFISFMRLERMNIV